MQQAMNQSSPCDKACPALVVILPRRRKGQLPMFTLNEVSERRPFVHVSQLSGKNKTERSLCPEMGHTAADYGQPRSYRLKTGTSWRIGSPFKR